MYFSGSPKQDSNGSRLHRHGLKSECVENDTHVQGNLQTRVTVSFVIDALSTTIHDGCMPDGFDGRTANTMNTWKNKKMEHLDCGGPAGPSPGAGSCSIHPPQRVSTNRFLAVSRRCACRTPSSHILIFRIDFVFYLYLVYFGRCQPPEAAHRCHVEL